MTAIYRPVVPLSISLAAYTITLYGIDVAYLTDNFTPSIPTTSQLDSLVG